jgi:hypothetical protein
MIRPGPYVCVDVGLFEDERFATCSLQARVLFVKLMCHAAAELTDGRIPAVLVPQLCAAAGVRRRALDELVDHGLVDRLGLVEGSPVAGDYFLQGFLKWNPSRESVEDRRRQNRDRQAAFRERESLKGRLRAV